jgi:hypothetical protein
VKIASPIAALTALIIASGIIVQGPASAAPVSITVNGTFTNAPDSLTVGPNIFSSLVGLNFTSTFSYDPTGSQINTEFASPAEGGSGQELGTEFTGGSVTPLIPALPVVPPDTNTYTSPTLVAEQENNVTRSPAELLNLLPGGTTFDFFTINGWQPGSTFSGGSTITGDGAAIDAVNFGLTFIDVDGAMIGGPLSASDLMPETVDLSLVDFVIVTIEEFENSERIGFAYQFGTIDQGGTFNNFTIVAAASEVSEPAMTAMFALGIAGLGFVRRRKCAAA